METHTINSKDQVKDILNTGAGTDLERENSSRMYKLMIYFAHSTMAMYSKEIVSNDKMFVSEFMESNKDLLQRVFDEGISIMNYKLSHNQMAVASFVYLLSKYFPESVSDTTAYIPSCK